MRIIFNQNGQQHELLVDSDIGKVIDKPNIKIFVLYVDSLPRVFTYNCADKKVRELVDFISKCKNKGKKVKNQTHESVTTNWFIFARNGNYLDLRRSNIVYVAKDCPSLEFSIHGDNICVSRTSLNIKESGNRRSSSNSIIYGSFYPVRYCKTNKELIVYKKFSSLDKIPSDLSNTGKLDNLITNLGN